MEVKKEVKMEKSLYDISWQVTEPEYRADPALSYSTLAKYERKGRFNALPTLFDKDVSPSLTFGSLVDCLLTGSKEEFDAQFFVAEFPKLSDALVLIANTLFARYGKVVDDVDGMFGEAHYYATIEEMPDNYLSEVGKQCDFWANDKWDNVRAKKIREGGIADYYKLLVLADGKEVINQKDVDDAYAAVEALKSSDNTEFYFASNNTEVDGIERLYQLKFKGEDPEKHTKFRCMADLIIVDYNAKTIQPCDLKTSSHNEWEFHKSMADWRYDIQARLYWRLIKQNIEKDEFFKDFKLLPYKFIVVNRINLQPMVWDFPLTEAEGLLTLKTVRNGVYLWRDPYTIGEELDYYLSNPECKVPKEMKKSNNIVDFLTMYI